MKQMRAVDNSERLIAEKLLGIILDKAKSRWKNKSDLMMENISIVEAHYL